MRTEEEILKELEKAKEHVAKTKNDAVLGSFWEGYKTGLEYALRRIA